MRSILTLFLFFITIGLFPVHSTENPSLFKIRDAQPDTYYPQAKHQLETGNYRKAHQLILKAIENDKQRYGAKHEKTARNLTLLATVVFNRGQFRSAKTYYLQSQVIRKTLFDQGNIIFTENQFGLANIEKVQGGYQLALSKHRAILDKRLKSPQKRNITESLMVVAELYQVLGQYDKSEEMLTQATQLIQRKSAQQQVLYARLLNQKGTLATAKGHYKVANRYEKKALDLLMKTYGRNNVLVADTLSNIANRLDVKGKYNLAIPLYQEASQIYRNQLGENNIKLASSLNHLSRILLKNGDDEKAIETNNKAYKMASAFIRKKHPFFALNQINRANYLLNRKEFTVARQLYAEALRTLKLTYGEQHPLIVKIKLDMKKLPNLISLTH